MNTQVNVIADPQLNTHLVGQQSHGFGETQIVDLLDEGDDVPAHATTKAVEETTPRGDLEAGGLLIVERAQPLQGTTARIAQLHIAAHHLVDAGSFTHQRDVLIVDSRCHGRQSRAACDGRDLLARFNSR